GHGASRARKEGWGRSRCASARRNSRQARWAAYRARPSSCAGCPLKAGCTPQEGRRLYRPLAVWAETEVGQFHQRLSLLMVGSTAAVALGGFVCQAGRPGSGLLLVAFLALAPLIVREARWLGGAGDRPEAGQGGQGARRGAACRAGGPGGV